MIHRLPEAIPDGEQREIHEIAPFLHMARDVDEDGKPVAVIVAEVDPDMQVGPLKIKAAVAVAMAFAITTEQPPPDIQGIDKGALFEDNFADMRGAVGLTIPLGLVEAIATRMAEPDERLVLANLFITRALLMLAGKCECKNCRENPQPTLSPKEGNA